MEVLDVKVGMKKFDLFFAQVKVLAEVHGSYLSPLGSHQRICTLRSKTSWQKPPSPLARPPPFGASPGRCHIPSSPFSTPKWRAAFQPRDWLPGLQEALGTKSTLGLAGPFLEDCSSVVALLVAQLDVALDLAGALGRDVEGVHLEKCRAHPRGSQCELNRLLVSPRYYPYH
ncbi:hypothetical protein Acr_00g0017920 [Actinidia rufa]|uniref:Uncharacterized protein n=1 Tax=Actinidia rufa TaxID=165716 RepID=A0A7J0DCQ9_9ERIC|nr:hypothetical protein Acr_00g0017920 [Actinidia rufa]